MKFDFSHVDISKGLAQIPQAFNVLISTPAFIKKHQLWKGFWDYSSVLIFSIIIAIAFSYTLYNDIHDYFVPNTDYIEEIKAEFQAVNEALINSTGEATAELQAEKQELQEKLEGKHKSLFSGSLKFLLLIFLEVLIFHFAVKTNNILKNENKILSFKQFYKAQIRMIKVMGRKWLFGLLMYVLVSIFCGITRTQFLKIFIMFFIYGYYLGFAFLDNYLEQFHFSIKKSATRIQSHFGAATVFGLFASILMNIPVLGPLVVPFICGIAATRYGYISQMESSSSTQK